LIPFRHRVGEQPLTTDIVEIYWNARPHLERLGVNLRRSEIDDRGQHLLEEVRKSLVKVFPGSPVLVRFAVHAKAPVNDLRVLRQGSEQPTCVAEVRAAIEHALQQAECEPA
jgi:alpha-D-ribose 1-methylphosphonate 5-phosphate C-P lyase